MIIELSLVNSLETDFNWKSLSHILIPLWLVLSRAKKWYSNLKNDDAGLLVGWLVGWLDFMEHQSL